MIKKYEQKFDKIIDELSKINQEAVKMNDDEEAKRLSCYLLEILEAK